MLRLLCGIGHVAFNFNNAALVFAVSQFNLGKSVNGGWMKRGCHRQLSLTFGPFTSPQPDLPRLIPLSATHAAPFPTPHSALHTPGPCSRPSPLHSRGPFASRPARGTPNLVS